jgi:hypothetical protein
MLTSSPNVRIGLMVGVGVDASSDKNEVSTAIVFKFTKTLQNFTKTLQLSASAAFAHSPSYLFD